MKTKNWIKENWLLIIPALIILAVLAGLYYAPTFLKAHKNYLTEIAKN